MEFLLFVGIVALVYYIATRNSTSSVGSVAQQLKQRNVEWAIFIAEYRSKAKTKDQKEFLESILTDIKSRGLPVPGIQSNYYDDTSQPNASQTTKQPPNNPSTSYALNTNQTVLKEASEPLDNTTLLLYFGAFLFVASVGLFVAFAKVGGILRTSAVALVMIVLYSGGVWLYHNKPKLKLAGLAFAGIGIAIMPLVGLAAYNYVFINQAREVWFATSIFSMLLYAHALVTLRKPLINYIFIFTFLSLFESGVSIISAPIYYFGWAMAFVGLFTQLMSQWKGFWPKLQESSRNSSQLFLPLAVIVSLVLVPEQGIGQLGVSLILASIFYALESWRSIGESRSNNIVVTHITALGGLMCLVYAVTGSLADTAIVLASINAIQLIGLWYLKSTTNIGQNYTNVLLVSSLASIILSLGNTQLVLSTVIAFIFICIVIWLKHKRTDAYGLATLAWIALPVIYGQYSSVARVDIMSQTGLLLGALMVQLIVMLVYGFAEKTSDWVSTARSTYLIGSIAVLVSAFLVGPSTAWVIATIITLSTMVLAYVDDLESWTSVGGILIAAPLFISWPNPDMFLGVLVTALGLNIILSLWGRQEINRWMSTILWLLLPVGFGHIDIISTWQPESYAWAYLIAMLGLILSRAIARGSVMLSTHVPLASFAKSASQPYVIGYITAALLAVTVSLNSVNSQTHTTLVLFSLILVVAFLGRYIENRSDIYTFIPVLAQFALWSGVRPTMQSGMYSYLLLSSSLAVTGYVFTSLVQKDYAKSKTIIYIKQTSLWCAFIAPASFLISTQTFWPMPLGLIIAGILLYDYLDDTTQDNRELAGGVIVVGFMWMLYYAGVESFQAYSHITATVFAGYAYWRTNRGEIVKADNYLMLMLATATIPLAIQAIGGQAGGVYGWWLLLEQIGFMLLGMSIRKRFVVRWGLYVALGSVLYQLRNLGWAALTVLAMFLIGLAVFRLQKHSDNN